MPYANHVDVLCQSGSFALVACIAIVFAVSSASMVFSACVSRVQRNQSLSLPASPSFQRFSPLLCDSQFVCHGVSGMLCSCCPHRRHFCGSLRFCGSGYHRLDLFVSSHCLFSFAACLAVVLLGCGLAAPSMLKYIDARHNIVNCNLKCGVSLETLQKISSQGSDAIIAMLGQTKLSDVEVAEVIGACQLRCTSIFGYRIVNFRAFAEIRP